MKPYPSAPIASTATMNQVRTGCCRHGRCTPSATAALTSAISSDSPHTPVSAVNWISGVTVFTG